MKKGSATKGKVSSLKSKVSSPEALAGDRQANGKEQMADGKMATEELKRVPYGLVKPDPDQPRKVFNEQKLRELADSIAGVGIKTPLLVRWVPGLKVQEPDLVEKNWQALDGKGRVVSSGSEKAVRDFVKGRDEGYYKIVFGERRWRAAGLLKLAEVPVIVTEMDDREVAAVQYIENQQRENLTALEEAEALKKMLEEERQSDPTFNADRLGKKIGKSRSHVFGQLALTRLHPCVREAVVAGRISVSIAAEVAKVPGEKSQAELLKEIERQAGYGRAPSVRDLQENIRRDYVKNLRGAPWDLEDEELVPGEWEVRTEDLACTIKGREPVVPADRAVRVGGHVQGNWGVFATDGRGVGYTVFGPAAEKSCRRLAQLIGAGQPIEVKHMRGGACATCPKRSGNLPKEEQQEKQSPNTCTDVECYQVKLQAATDRRLKAAREEGQTVLKPGEAFDEWGCLNRKYVKLSDRCYDLGYDHDKDWKKTLGDKCPPPILAPKADGEVVEVITVEEARQALKARGLKPKESQDRSVDLALQRKEKEFTAVAQQAAPKIIGALVGGIGTTIDDRLWLPLAEQVYHHTSIDQHSFLAKGRGWARTQTESRDKIQAWFATKPSPAECAQFIVELLLVTGWNGGGWNGVKWSPEFLELCGWAGVDIKKLQAEKATTPPPAKVKK